MRTRVTHWRRKGRELRVDSRMLRSTDLWFQREPISNHRRAGWHSESAVNILADFLVDRP
jgi:hypothetical protein